MLEALSRIFDAHALRPVRMSCGAGSRAIRPFRGIAHSSPSFRLGGESSTVNRRSPKLVVVRAIVGVSSVQAAVDVGQFVIQIADLKCPHSIILAVACFGVEFCPGLRHFLHYTIVAERRYNMSGSIRRNNESGDLLRKLLNRSFTGPSRVSALAVIRQF